MTDVLRIANISAFYGDRDNALGNALSGASYDVLVGDYLAEITMGILARQRESDPQAGYARSLVRQLQPHLRTLLASGTKLITNAGGVNPGALASRIMALGEEQGLDPSVAHIEGDDLHERINDLDWLSGLRHLHDGTRFARRPETILAATAYLGSWGIAAALAAGASIVVCPRVTDAAVAIGPAAWRFGWASDDWDQLAAAAVAGHVLECSGQATGGNFAFYEEVPNLLDGAGRPVVEIAGDGSFEVGLQPGAGGTVTVETLTAQLLYEVDGPRYLTPDVTVHWDSIQLEQVGDDLVRVSGVRGGPPPTGLKAGLSHVVGYRNSMTIGATGPDSVAKLQLAIDTLDRRVEFERLDEVRVAYLRRVDHVLPLDEAEIVEARVSVAAIDRDLVDRSFANEVVGLSLETYPGFFLVSPPEPARPLIGYWPTSIPRRAVTERVFVNGIEHAAIPFAEFAPIQDHGPMLVEDGASEEEGPTELVQLGLLAGARSGDKGGNANVGVWGRTERAYEWLASFLTVDRFKSLVPETTDLRVDRHFFPHLKSLNFVIFGILGEGAAASLRPDPQAKGLGEYLRSRYVPAPRELVESVRKVDG